MNKMQWNNGSQRKILWAHIFFFWGKKKQPTIKHTKEMQKTMHQQCWMKMSMRCRPIQIQFIALCERRRFQKIIIQFVQCTYDRNDRFVLVWSGLVWSGRVACLVCLGFFFAFVFSCCLSVFISTAPVVS